MFDRLRRRAPQHCGADGIWSQAQFYGCGTWDVEGLAEAHDELDGLEKGKERRRRSVSSRSLAWMSTTGLGGLRPPAVGRV